MPGFAKQNLTLMFGTELKKRDLLWKYGLSLLPLGGGGLIIIVSAFLQIKHWLNDSTVSQKMLFESKFQQRVLTGKMQIEAKGWCWYDWLNQFCICLHLYLWYNEKKQISYKLSCYHSTIFLRNVKRHGKTSTLLGENANILYYKNKETDLTVEIFKSVAIRLCLSLVLQQCIKAKLDVDKEDRQAFRGDIFLYLYFKLRCICILRVVYWIWTKDTDKTQGAGGTWVDKKTGGAATDKLTWWTSDCLDKNVVVFVFCIELYLCLCCSSALPPKTSRSGAPDPMLFGKFWIQEYQKKNWYCAHKIIKQTDDKKADNRF